MDKRFIMTAFGKDRPGIVADVTKILYENGCNLEDNTMTLLADEFTLVLLFSAKEPGIEELLLKECRRLEKDKGVSAFIRPLEARAEISPAVVVNYALHVEGLDQAGIVYKISQFLADHAINIIDLKSTVMASPESGTTIYRMDIHIQVPTTMPLSELEGGLSEVADALNVDISL